MKVIKWIFIVLVIIILLVLLIAAFLPSEYTVERSSVINKPVEEVYASIVDFNLRQQWDPWLALDPEVKVTLKVAEGWVGSRYAWESDMKNLGKGEMIIENVVENESINSRLVFLSPMEMESDVYWKFEATEGGTKVYWGNTGTLPYPFGRLAGLGFDSMMGPDFVRGLNNLKEMIEKETVEEE
jgi:uncharacterized protein YndB with AHSA1/START domain